MFVIAWLAHLVWLLVPATSNEIVCKGTIVSVPFKTTLAQEFAVVLTLKFDVPAEVEDPKIVKVPAANVLVIPKGNPETVADVAPPPTKYVIFVIAALTHLV